MIWLPVSRTQPACCSRARPPSLPADFRRARRVHARGSGYAHRAYAGRLLTGPDPATYAHSLGCSHKLSLSCARHAPRPRAMRLVQRRQRLAMRHADRGARVPPRGPPLGSANFLQPGLSLGLRLLRPAPDRTQHWSTSALAHGSTQALKHSSTGAQRERHYPPVCPQPPFWCLYIRRVQGEGRGPKIHRPT
jgi:hypothetical protein